MGAAERPLPDTGVLEQRLGVLLLFDVARELRAVHWAVKVASELETRLARSPSLAASTLSPDLPDLETTLETAQARATDAHAACEYTTRTSPRLNHVGFTCCCSLTNLGSSSIYLTLARIRNAPQNMKCALTISSNAPATYANYHNLPEVCLLRWLIADRC